jgi:xanthosine utilization system XapX-like protein
MPRNRTLKIVAGIVVSFTGLVGTIILLSVTKIISSAMAMLMLVALLGMYIGFGILIAVYRLIGKLE